MDNSIISQLYSLFIFAIAGICIGIFFDIFRILRKSFKTPDFITYLEDIIFWVFTGIFLLFILFTFQDGQIRSYNIIGLIIGISIYLLLISKYFVKINVLIISIIKKIINKILSIILFPIKLIIKPFSFVIINIRKDITNFDKKIKNNVKKFYGKKDFKKKCRKI